ncbi:MAG: hypothetical protein HRT44_00800 [Bdellovibrionales bacterium]|nr:hypothetical protein [Bdellovibrionales bacterium]NQZ17788.1 hypothetical protein [Bdellovibrionales bacterium]
MNKVLTVLAVMSIASAAFAKPKDESRSSIREIKCQVESKIAEEQEAAELESDVEIVADFAIELTSKENKTFVGQQDIKLVDPDREALVQAKMSHFDGKRLIEMGYSDSNDVQANTDNIVIKEGKEIATHRVRLEIDNGMSVDCFLVVKKVERPKKK